MRGRTMRALVPMVALALAGCSASTSGRDSGGGGGDAGGDAGTVRDGAPTTDGRVGNCADMDNDGIPDLREGSGDDDGDGMPNVVDTDSDGDGFLDLDEAVGNYPGFPSAHPPPLACGLSPDDCDADNQPNFRDVDSDNDGLTDPEEMAAHLNPCAADTDGDGYSDLTEVVAGTDGNSMASQPPLNSLYVTLPYHTEADPTLHVHKKFDFATQIRAADIMFLIDTTVSMQDTIDNVSSTLSTSIIPRIVDALGPRGDARYGVAAHGDFAEGDRNPDGSMQTDGALTVYQKLDFDATRAQFAVSMLQANAGGDYPEAQIPAMHALVAGFGTPEYRGTATRMVDPAGDCGSNPDSPIPFGWGCFLPGRVPIIVAFTDAEMHNYGAGSNFYVSVPMAARYPALKTAMQQHGVLFVGIDVNVDSATYDATHPMGRNSFYSEAVQLARDTGTLDMNRMPIAFRGSASTVADNVVDAITTIIGQTRQDITTRVDPDPNEARLPPAYTTADFIKAVTPDSASPEAPDGYDRRDATTFYNVLPTTSVTFDVDFYNDFQPGGHSAQLFQATIQVLGRAQSVVDSRQVFIVVPAEGGTPPG